MRFDEIFAPAVSDQPSEQCVKQTIFGQLLKSLNKHEFTFFRVLQQHIYHVTDRTQLRPRLAQLQLLILLDSTPNSPTK
jgi:hypothetical protein